MIENRGIDFVKVGKGPVSFLRLEEKGREDVKGKPEGSRCEMHMQ